MDALLANCFLNEQFKNIRKKPQVLNSVQLNVLGVASMKSIDQILELLQDSKWHPEGEIKNLVSLPEEKIQTIFEFLEENMFISQDKDGGRVKIENLGLQFLDLPSE
jgi:hypothetical protein